MDVDSSTKSVLKHRYVDLKEKAESEGISYDWPKYKSGGKKPDNGLLPLDHPEPKFKADNNHRLRDKSKKEHALANAPKY